MATLHIRNVPDRVVEILKRRAERGGRSLNSEVVETLSDSARTARVDEILAEIDRIRATIENPPTGDEIVEWIRRGRDERADHVWQESTRPRLDS